MNFDKKSREVRPWPCRESFWILLPVLFSIEFCLLGDPPLFGWSSADSSEDSEDDSSSIANGR